MLEKIIHSIIFLQIFVWLFHAWIGIEEWRNFNTYDSQTLFILFLSLGGLAVYLRLKNTPQEWRSINMIFEQATLIGIICWFFYQSWWSDWEVFLLIFTIFSLLGSIIFGTIQSQTQNLVGWGNWGLPDYFWWLWSILTLINTISISLIFILLHQDLSSLWIFFGISWIFLWKKYPL